MKISRIVYTKINIEGIDRLKLLKQLWEQRQPALFYKLYPEATVPDWNEDEAKAVLTCGYIDYFCGRRIKTDITKNIIDTTEYNDDIGPTFEDAINTIKQNQ